MSALRLTIVALVSDRAQATYYIESGIGPGVLYDLWANKSSCHNVGSVPLVRYCYISA